MSPKSLTADVAVVGGGLGGVAAALAAADAGRTVLLMEETDRIGGQVTSQGVAALDEHPLIEHFGGTRSYYRFREGVRDHYRREYGAPATMPDGSPLNPGNGWVSRLCFEPRVGRVVLESMLEPHVTAGRLSILTDHAPVKATIRGGRITSVELRGRDAEIVRVEATVYLDATEWGDLLPLAGAPYVFGAESRGDTGEPHAPVEAAPGETQSFTHGFAVEHRPGEDHTIPKPPGYEKLRDAQPFTLELLGADGESSPYRMFVPGPTGLPPFWTYRRLRDGRLLDPSGGLTDVALVNWPGNDYARAGVLDVTRERREEVFEDTRRLSRAFLYWLQTEAPRDDGNGRGYPGLRLSPETTETADGFARSPYVREARRLRATGRVREQDLVPAGDGAARATNFSDSVGVGWYHLDLHGRVGNSRTLYLPTLPFQIPLSALLPPRPANLLAAAKNVGTTQLAGGAYRVHPVEWNTGEAAGAATAYALDHDLYPGEILSRKRHLRRLQRRLLDRGVPLFWFTDVSDGHPLFVPAQLLGVAGRIPPQSVRWSELRARPERAVTLAEEVEVGVEGCPTGEPGTWGATCAALADHLGRRTGKERA